eukprot:359093-Chlamydomonas_euryale.AAC.9
MAGYEFLSGGRMYEDSVVVCTFVCVVWLLMVPFDMFFFSGIGFNVTVAGKFGVTATGTNVFVWLSGVTATGTDVFVWQSGVTATGTD